MLIRMLLDWLRLSVLRFTLRFDYFWLSGVRCVYLREEAVVNYGSVEKVY